MSVCLAQHVGCRLIPVLGGVAAVSWVCRHNTIARKQQLSVKDRASTILFQLVSRVRNALRML